MSTNNRFLQSNLTTNDLATETGQRKVISMLEDGISVDVSSLPVGGSSMTVADVDFSAVGSQTELLAVANPNLELADGQSLVAGDKGSVIMSVLDGKARFVNMGSNGGVITTVRDIDFTGGQTSSVNVSIDEAKKAGESWDSSDKGIIPVGIDDLGVYHALKCVNDGILSTSANLESINENAVSTSYGKDDVGSQRMTLSRKSALASLGCSMPEAFSNSSIVSLRISGHNSDVDNGSASELSDGFSTAGQFLELPPLAGITSFSAVSTSAADDPISISPLPTGAHMLIVYYQSELGVVGVSYVTLNGTVEVQTTGIAAGACVRFLGVSVLTAGSDKKNAGLITIYKTGDPTAIYDQITPSSNVSASGKAYIPPNCIYFPRIINCHTFTAGSDDVRIQLETKGAESDIWRRSFSFIANAPSGGANDRLSWPLYGSVVSAAIASGDLFTTKGFDMRFTAEKLSSGGSVSVSAYLGGFYTSTA